MVGIVEIKIEMCQAFYVPGAKRIFEPDAKRDRDRLLYHVASKVAK